MSGPFGINMTLISGQEISAEIVVAASTFLSRGFVSISLVSIDGCVREEFSKALEIFRIREGIYYHDGPDYFAKKLIEPNNGLSTKDLFWLALDKEGESLAKTIFEANGESPAKTIYRSVHKLNLIEQEIVSPPQARLPLELWEESRKRHFSLSLDYGKQKPNESRQSYMSNHAPLMPEQKLYYEWCEQLYESLIPWQDIIKNIQSDFS